MASSLSEALRCARALLGAPRAAPLGDPRRGVGEAALRVVRACTGYLPEPVMRVADLQLDTCLVVGEAARVVTLAMEAADIEPLGELIQVLLRLCASQPALQPCPTFCHIQVAITELMCKCVCMDPVPQELFHVGLRASSWLISHHAMASFTAFARAGGSPEGGLNRLLPKNVSPAVRQQLIHRLGKYIGRAHKDIVSTFEAEEDGQRELATMDEEASKLQPWIVQASAAGEGLEDPIRGRGRTPSSAMESCPGSKGTAAHSPAATSGMRSQQAAGDTSDAVTRVMTEVEEGLDLMQDGLRLVQTALAKLQDGVVRQSNEDAVPNKRKRVDGQLADLAQGLERAKRALTQ
ncbi:hypothetical protein CYMTET_49501 [Cymbomonas tetramitiformis]|uniref:Uncharacterized protein n=1 Tax=Cymbomonas tetramitiformis TaxID=36881 RepID=A0AAE0BRR5_9CHLO|nr:hypothetical protein CYMTET_49501 [Cymbomonas tetramitiformis]